MTAISSAQNANLKLVRRLSRRRARQQEGLFVVEGEDLVAAGLETGATPRVILVDAHRPPALAAPVDVVQAVEPALLADVSELAYPPRVIGVFEFPEHDRAFASGTAPWLLLDAVADPGNVGTAIRTAAAFCAGGVALRSGSADPFGSKAMRASMGSCFRLPLAQVGDVAEIRAAASRIVVLDASGTVPLAEAGIDDSTVLVVGAERDGIDPELLGAADVVASIPQDPAVESLNAGVAASLALYEWRRSRA